MPLNKDVLGVALYTARNAFDDKTIDELIAIHGSLDNVRLAMAKADADAIINHIKTAGIVTTVGSSTTQTGTMV